MTIVPEQLTVFPEGADLRAAPSRPVAQRVDAMVRARAAALPESVAVDDGSRTTTYAELLELTDRVGERLGALGVAPREPVAVRGKRSAWFYAALLAILEYDAVLLPLGDRLTDERLRAQMEAAGARHIVTANVEGVELLNTEPPGPGGATEATLHPPEAAYITFTSGTTGAPRGILGARLGLGHFVEWQAASFGLGPGDRSAQLTDLAFDVGLRDVFTPLAAGATLCPPPEEAEPGEIGRWLVDAGITMTHAVPTLAREWVGGAAGVGGPRIVFFAGEPLAATLVDAWRRAFPRTKRIVNLYGPSEATLAQFWHEVADPPEPGIQPVGQPIPDVEAFLSPTGEVAIRSPYLSLGYLGGSHAADRFRSNPATGDSSDRVFMTGDLGRVGASGALELRGRTDDQVKVDGVRVEPAGVAAALESHPDIAAAAVVALGGDRVRLRAVVVVRDRAPTPVELRAYLRRLLPDSAVPAEILQLDALPVTQRGKLDRDAVRALSTPRAGPSRPEEDADELRSGLAGILAAVLGLDSIAVDDDFFDLGGHSLLATKAVSQIRKRYGVRLPLRRFFDEPTARQIAAAVADLQSRQ